MSIKKWCPEEDSNYAKKVLRYLTSQGALRKSGTQNGTQRPIISAMPKSAATARRNLPAHVRVSRTGVYQYRRRVPETLRELLGKREIKKSLGKDYGAMLKAHAKLEATVQTLFAQKPKPARQSNVRAKVLSVLRDHGFRSDELAIISDGFTEEDEGAFYALDEVLEELQRDPEVPDEIIRGVARGRLPVTLETAIDEYVALKKTGDPGRDRVTEVRWVRHKARLVRFLGKEAVTQRRLDRLRRADARRVIEGYAAEMRPASVRRYMNDIRAVVSRAIREHDINMQNPFKAPEIAGGTSGQADRLPLSDEDMAKLDPVMGTDDDLGLIWLILRDTGARQREITGLRRCDVNLDRKTISIREHHQRPLKSRNSEREVPIPDGLAERLAAKADAFAGEELLFPQYVGGRRSDACSAALNKRLRQHVSHKRKAVYSLRHRMKDLLRDTDCPESLAREIMGHSEQSIAANYGRGSSLERKRRALEKAWAKT